MIFLRIITDFYFPSPTRGTEVMTLLLCALPELCIRSAPADFGKRVYQGVRVKHTVKDLLAEKRSRSRQSSGSRFSVSPDPPPPFLTPSTHPILCFKVWGTATINREQQKNICSTKACLKTSGSFVFLHL